MRWLRRAVDVWVATPKWWKGFYITFPLSLAVLAVATANAGIAAQGAFVWASSVALALWASERLKARRRGPPPRPGHVPPGVDPNDLRRRR